MKLETRGYWIAKEILALIEETRKYNTRVDENGQREYKFQKYKS